MSQQQQLNKVALADAQQNVTAGSSSTSLPPEGETSSSQSKENISSISWRQRSLPKGPSDTSGGAVGGGDYLGNKEPKRSSSSSARGSPYNGLALGIGGGKSPRSNSSPASRSTASTVAAAGGGGGAIGGGGYHRFYGGNASRIYVGGLMKETEAKTLELFFSKFGVVRNARVLKDDLGQSRHYAFVQFETEEGAAKAVQERVPIIDGKVVEVKFAKPDNSSFIRKMFVGGLSQETTQEDLENYFSQYGNVECVNLLMDEQTKRNRGFAFVCMQQAAVAINLCKLRFHVINGRSVECKRSNGSRRVEPKPPRDMGIQILPSTYFGQNYDPNQLMTQMYNYRPLFWPLSQMGFHNGPYAWPPAEGMTPVNPVPYQNYQTHQQYQPQPYVSQEQQQNTYQQLNPSAPPFEYPAFFAHLAAQAGNQQSTSAKTTATGAYGCR